jgi:hypothetical protein
LLTSVSIVICFISPSILLPFLSTFHGFLISQQKLAIFGQLKTGWAVGKQQVTEAQKNQPV